MHIPYAPTLGSRRHDEQVRALGRHPGDACAACGNPATSDQPVRRRADGYRKHADSDACHLAAQARIAAAAANGQ
jgi:hypothetical protein